MVTGLISGGDPAGDEMFTGGLRRVAWGNSKIATIRAKFSNEGRSSCTRRPGEGLDKDGGH